MHFADAGRSGLKVPGGKEEMNKRQKMRIETKVPKFFTVYRH